MDYKAANKDLWDKWTKLHLDSALYNMEAFRSGASSLIGPEAGLLGDLSGKRVLHLQCYFGQDSLSMARLGASVVGVDLSGEAVNIANMLADEMQLDAKFYAADVMDMNNLLREQFDLVYTSYGVLIWLPDLAKWARTVAGHVKPGGRFLLVEFHPVGNLFNEDFTRIEYTYFREDPVIEKEAGSYAAPEAVHIEGNSVTWDFSISEVLTPLLNEGLILKGFQKYKHAPYNLYKNAVKTENGYQVRGLEGKIPYLFSVDMVKP